ncbi:MAG: response regulator [Mariprofundaceae bacterium]
MDILLIDDDDHVHQIVESYLDRFGREKKIPVNLKNIHDPVQGIFELCKSMEPYDVIALDLKMPKMSGNEIFEFLIFEKSHLVNDVLFVTCYSDALEARYPEQKLHILNKPFRYEAFAEALDSMTG